MKSIQLNKEQKLTRLHELIDKRGDQSKNLSKVEQEEYSKLIDWYEDNFRAV